jgi:hypothetical protein
MRAEQAVTALKDKFDQLKKFEVEVEEYVDEILGFRSSTSQVLDEILGFQKSSSYTDLKRDDDDGDK